MSKRTYNRVPDDVRDRAIGMAERGWKAHAIARKLGINPSTVYGIVMVAGVHKPEQRDEAVRLVRNGGDVVRFDRAEDAFIVEQSEAGVGVCEIARRILVKFGRVRSGSTVGRRKAALAALEVA